jgi:hypothetical protein
MNPMRQTLKGFAMILASLAMIWGCDNGYADIPVVDNPPKINIGSITGGTSAGEDFVVSITLSDALEGSTISSLGELRYVITGGGATVASGTETLNGWRQTVTIRVTGGFEAGDYNLDVTATDSNGNPSVENKSFTVNPAKPSFDITGDWRMDPVPSAFKVGPTAGNGEWYTSTDSDVATRDCFFDDVYTFSSDGSFSIELDGSTWLEKWQGVGEDSCGVPVAPFDGTGSYSYTYTSSSLTLVGKGAYLGLSKVNNSGEISNGAAVADEITYTIVDQIEDGETRKMTLRIEAGSGVWWEYKLISGPAQVAEIVGDWKVEPIAGSLTVGPTEGSTEWFNIPATEVTARACFYDDVYTFNQDGTFTIAMGSQTWLEPWQGVVESSCGVPVAPYNGSGTYNYTFNGTSLNLSGTGAFVALAKVNNTGELPNVAVPTEINYKVASYTKDGDTKRMTLSIEAGTGVWWTFKLISE